MANAIINTAIDNIIDLGNDKYTVQVFMYPGIGGLNGRYHDIEMNAQDILHTFGIVKDEISEYIK